MVRSETNGPQSHTAPFRPANPPSPLHKKVMLVSNPTCGDRVGRCTWALALFSNQPYVLLHVSSHRRDLIGCIFHVALNSNWSVASDCVCAIGLSCWMRINSIENAFSLHIFFHFTLLGLASMFNISSKINPCGFHSSPPITDSFKPEKFCNS